MDNQGKAIFIDCASSYTHDRYGPQPLAAMPGKQKAVAEISLQPLATGAGKQI